MKSLKITSFLILALSLAPSVQLGLAKTYPRGDGWLRIFNYHLNEWAEFQFRKQNELIPTGLNQANQILRSRDNSEATPIDPRLLDLIDHLQDYFKVDTVEIISGYRRQELNEKLLKAGRKVSPRSLHMQGQALDIHLDEIKEESLRDYLKNLQLGGVGYYGPLDFVHIDTGPFKTWGESGPFGQKLIGVLQPQGAIQLTSHQNDYLPHETLEFTWKFKKGFSQKDLLNIRLEHFFRGQWKKCPSNISLSLRGRGETPNQLKAKDLYCPQKEIPQRRFGKYRWIFTVKDKKFLFSSNEFYLKNH